MPADPANPGRPRPDEGDLLAFLEGEPLAREREIAVAKALEADAALALRVQRMRADRIALKALPEVAAPAGLLEGVDAALQPVLERRMLLGLRDGEPMDSRPPISLVQPVRRSVLATIFAEPAGRYSALAAGLLLLIGGAAYWAATSWWPSTGPAPVTVAEHSSTPEPSLAAKAPHEKPASLAIRPEEAPRSESGVSAEAPVTSIASDEPPAAPPAEAPAEATLAANDAPAQGMSTDHALQLASEGRLVIRLIAPDPVVMAQPDRIAEHIRRSQSAAWRLGDPAPAELASALNAPPVHASPEPERDRPERAILDNSARSAFPQFEGPPAPGSEWTPPPAATVYVVQTRLDGAAIDSLRNALAPYGEPTLEESPEPLPLDGAPLNPAAVLRWSQSPAGWTSWTSVPVVIDQAR